jgi:hypothetical protein
MGALRFKEDPRFNDGWRKEGKARSSRKTGAQAKVIGKVIDLVDAAKAATRASLSLEPPQLTVAPPPLAKTLARMDAAIEMQLTLSDNKNAPGPGHIHPPRSLFDIERDAEVQELHRNFVLHRKYVVRTSKQWALNTVEGFVKITNAHAKSARTKVRIALYLSVFTTVTLILIAWLSWRVIAQAEFRVMQAQKQLAAMQLSLQTANAKLAEFSLPQTQSPSQPAAQPPVKVALSSIKPAAPIQARTVATPVVTVTPTVVAPVVKSAASPVKPTAKPAAQSTTGPTAPAVAAKAAVPSVITNVTSAATNSASPGPSLPAPSLPAEPVAAHIGKEELEEALQRVRIETVATDKSGIAKLSPGTVEMRSGLIIRVGEQFPSKEKLLLVDIENARVVTSTRQILLK